MKVKYPGPAVSKRGGSHFPFLKVTLKPGINEVKDNTAKYLLSLGIVSKVEYEYRGPVPTEGEEVVVPEAPPETTTILGDEEE